jgi:hypothetical protein
VCFLFCFAVYGFRDACRKSAASKGILSNAAPIMSENLFTSALPPLPARIFELLSLAQFSLRTL